MPGKELVAPLNNTKPAVFDSFTRTLVSCLFPPHDIRIQLFTPAFLTTALELSFFRVLVRVGQYEVQDVRNPVARQQAYINLRLSARFFQKGASPSGPGAELRGTVVQIGYRRRG